MFRFRLEVTQVFYSIYLYCYLSIYFFVPYDYAPVDIRKYCKKSGLLEKEVIHIQRTPEDPQPQLPH